MAERGIQPTRQPLPPHEYRAPAGSLPPVVRVYYLTQGQTPAQLQEIVNIARSLADVQRFFPYAPLRA